MKRYALILCGLLCAAALLAQNVANYMEQGGSRWVIGGSLDVATGGDLDIEFGGAFKIAGTNRTTALSTSPAAVAAGYKVARGEVTLDGSNPTPATTGLATVVACSITDKRATTPALDPYIFTIDYAGGVTAGVLNVYAWKVTSAIDATLVASTDADDVISWVCIGT